MPSRRITDCVHQLQVAYTIALNDWEEKYPDLPLPFLTCTYRSPAEQAELYAIGRTKPGKKVTNAKPGQSKHNTLPSCAFDIGFIGLNKKMDWSPELFEKFAELIKKYDVKWGGDFKSIKDRPHFEV